MSGSKKMKDPRSFQKKMIAVMAVVLCATLVLSLVAGLLVY